MKKTTKQELFNGKNYNSLRDVHNEAQRLMRFTKRELSNLPADEIFDLFEAAGKYVPKQAEQFASQLGIEGLKSINVVCFRKKVSLGLCSKRGEIRISFKAFFCCGYSDILHIIIQELCHLRHHNHSIDFWHLLERCLKDVGIVSDDYDGWNKSLMNCKDHMFMYSPPWNFSDHPQKYMIVEKKIRSNCSFNGAWLIRSRKNV